jgi:hypothetical protein
MATRVRRLGHVCQFGPVRVDRLCVAHAAPAARRVGWPSSAHPRTDSGRRPRLGPRPARCPPSLAVVKETERKKKKNNNKSYYFIKLKAGVGVLFVLLYYLAKDLQL